MINHNTVATRIRQYEKKHYKSPKFLDVSVNEHMAIRDHEEYTPAYMKEDIEDGDSYMGLTIRIHYDETEWEVT